MDFFFDLEIPLTSFKEHQSDILPSLFADESVLVLHDFPANFRREALTLISKFSEDLDPFVTYLAVNYMDRFIFAQKLVNQENPWIVGLVAISCLSLSVKMKNSDLGIPDLQGYECSMIYDPKSISRMEVLILTSLKWRMRSITPFSFLYYFLSLSEIEDPCLSQAIKDRASQIILKSSYGIKFLEFRPSVIAASALLLASQHLVPLQHSQFRAAIFSCKYLNKESLEECLDVMRNMASDTKESTSVLDLQCKSSESEDNTRIKRRKLNGVLNNDRCIIQFS